MNAWKSTRCTLHLLLTFLGALGFTFAVSPAASLAASSTIVISQVYGGGGNTGATYTNDFIELHNRSDATVSLTGWSVQYASAAGSSWSTTALSGSIPAGGYFLVQQAAGTGGTTALPTPDVTGTIAMSATAGKVALVSSTTALSGACPTGGSLVDFIGYGTTANCSESFPTSTLSNTLAALRDREGCADTDDNAADFATGPAVPRNSASPTRSCQYTLGALAGPLAGGSIGRSPDQATYLDGSTVMLTAMPATGWHFVGWSGDASGAANPLSVAMDADKSITGTFAINEYTLTYTAGANGSISGTSPQTVAHGSDGSTVTAVPDAGYHFVSWSDGVLTAARTEIGVTADVTVSASFAINEYTLTYTAGANGSISGTSPQTVAHGSDGSTVTAVPDAGYHFVGWSDGVLTAARTEIGVTADVTVSASFAINEYTLTYTAGANGSISGTSPQTVAHGSDGTTVTAVPDAGYHFVSWSDGVLTAARTEIGVTADVTVSASFAINEYTLTYTAGANGSISGTSPQTVAHGSDGSTVTAVPDAGYHFVSWSDGVLTAARTEIGVTADVTVSASFAINEYTLTYTAGANGSISGTSPQTVAHGSDGTTVTAVPDAGYHFVSWSDGVLTAARTEIGVTADVTVSASFAINEYTLTVATVGSGAVVKLPDQPTYDHGSNVQLTATAAVGWHFVGWSGDASGSTNPLDVTMDADKSITATFHKNQVVVSQVYGGGGNTGATYTNDFIELFNRGTSPVDVTGWTVQYGSSGGTTWLSTPLSGTILPGRYLLVQEAQGSGGSTSLPTPDVTGTIAMSATAGKVALVNNGVALSGACPVSTSIEDLIGYGTANCSETAPIGALSNLNAAHRKSAGCIDTDDNSADLLISPPTPRNSASPFNNCEFTLAVTVDPAASGTVAASPDLPSYANGALVTLTATPAYGFHFVKWTGDASGNSNPIVVTMNSSKSIVAHFASNSLVDGIVISQIYGGGGNTGSTYKQDYVELYNRGNFAVNITGWSLQYASDNGSTWFSTNLIGTIQPGQNYLIKQAQGVGGTLDIPLADAIGTVALSAIGGKLALCTDGVVLSGSCPTGPTIVDYVGYGSSDCFEVAAAPTLDNINAGFRNSDGCDDTNDNSADFSGGAPTPRNSATPIHFCPEWVDVGTVAVTEFALSPVAPNPSHGAARVSFALPVEARVRLQIMDLQGRMVSSLVEGSLPAGRHSLMWDGSTPGGPARSGMYFVRFEANGKRFVRSVMLTR